MVCFNYEHAHATFNLPVSNYNRYKLVLQARS